MEYVVPHCFQWSEKCDNYRTNTCISKLGNSIPPTYWHIKVRGGIHSNSKSISKTGTGYCMPCWKEDEVIAYYSRRVCNSLVWFSDLILRSALWCRTKLNHKWKRERERANLVCRILAEVSMLYGGSYIRISYRQSGPQLLFQLAIPQPSGGKVDRKFIFIQHIVSIRQTRKASCVGSCII